MGGLLIAISIVIPTLLWADLSNRFVWIAVLSTCAFAAIGFADDYTKVVHRRNLGLTGKAKLGYQVAASVLIAVALIVMQTRGLYSTRLMVPFVKTISPRSGDQFGRAQPSHLASCFHSVHCFLWCW